MSRTSTNGRSRAATTSTPGWNAARRGGPRALRRLGRVPEGPVSRPWSGMPRSGAGGRQSVRVRASRCGQAVYVCRRLRTIYAAANSSASRRTRRAPLSSVHREARGQAGVGPVSGQLFAVSNIPIRVPEHFLGRDDALAKIDEALKRGEGRVAITRCTDCEGSARQPSQQPTPSAIVPSTARRGG